MAATLTNGELSAPTHTSTADTPVADHKRKRDDDSSLTQQSDLPDTRLKHIQRDLLEVLERHDAQPSFLKHALPDPPANEPSNKKPRLSDPNATSTTIAAKLKSYSYASLQQIKSDAAAVTEDIISSVRVMVKEREASMNGRPTVEQLKQIQRAQAFETLIKELVDKEEQYVALHNVKDTELKKEHSDLANGQKSDSKLATNKAGTVLTLFGSAPTPKQLFSSMQQETGSARGAMFKSELPVEEMSLPNGIAATRVMPGSDMEEGKTFEDSFPAPYNLAPLNPPKHKKAATRDTKITWEFKDPVQRNRKGGYTVQPLTVGHWLNYGGVDETDPTISREKRTQRSRALSSSGDATESPEKAMSDEALAKEEEALFRKAYSSFAPTYDDSNAVIPHETKNMAWWDKVGRKRYSAAYAVDPALMDETENARLPPPPIEDIPAQDNDFSTIVDDLDELDKITPDQEPVKSKTDVEQVLREISELLETLSSHQRIRNATLTSSRDSVSRTPISPAPAVSSKVDKADEPSEEEYTTYHSLQRELAYLILKLPPYAVAKLDGDQLSELGVSKLIKIHSNNIKGSMEEDLVTRQAKLSAMATASSIAALARPNSSAGQHYNTTAARTPAIGQAANTRYGQQYASSKTPAVAQFQRQNSGQSAYSTPTAATVPRPNYAQTSQWARPGAAQPGYGQANPQALYHRPMQTPSGYGHYNYASTPQQQSYRPPATPQQYQQHLSQSAAVNAVKYQTSAAQSQAYNRTASPAKGYPAVSMGPAPQQQRAIYPGQQQPQQHPGSGRATPTGYPSQPNTPVNGYRPPPGLAPRPASSTPQPQTNGTSIYIPIGEPRVCEKCGTRYPNTKKHYCQKLDCQYCGTTFKYTSWLVRHEKECQRKSRRDSVLSSD